MPVFVCDKCHGIDNSALDGNYWERLLDKRKGFTPPRLCCECHTGKWHNQFPKRIFEKGQSKKDFDYVPKGL